MKLSIGALLALFLLFALVLPWSSFAATSNPNYKISGPYNSRNLQVFLIKGSDTMKGQEFLTLSEALAKKELKVFETGSVNELAVQNFSKQPVFIQSGDIVKGGQQDRTMQYDIIVPPNSKRMPISSFCVENGRWTGRGSEPTDHFSSSNSMGSMDLKMAARYDGDQGKVWSKVAEVQGKLAAKTKASVVASASPTSYQLTLENKDVEKAKGEYAKQLSDLAAKNPDAIGYAFAIDGKLKNADIYASHNLFVKLWPKLLQATAVEAVAAPKPAPTAAPAPAPKVADVDSFLHSTAHAKPAQKQVSDDTNQVTRDSSKAVYFETQASKQGNAWLHRNYMTK